MQNIIKETKFIWFDGEFMETNKAMISPLTHNMHYAGSVFEGMRSYNGVVFKETEHWQRLLYSANDMGLNCKYTIEELSSACHKLLKKCALIDAYIRPLIWRGPAAIKLFSDELYTQILICARPSNPEFVLGKRLKIGELRKHDPRSINPQSKSSIQYATSVQMRSKLGKDYDDILLLDLEDKIAECSVSNIFFAKGNKIVTPIADRFLNGITRCFVIEMAKEMGYQVSEERINISDIHQFDNCFTTGTATEIAGVGSIELQSGAVINYQSDITIKLQNAFEKKVNKTRKT